MKRSLSMVLGVVALSWLLTGCDSESSDNGADTYDLVAYMYPGESMSKIYDGYEYEDGTLSGTYLQDGTDEVTILDNTMTTDTGTYSYNDSYVSVANEVKRHVAIGEAYWSDETQTCVITDHLSSYTYPNAEGYTYADVLEETCTYMLGDEVDKNKTYYAKGLGMVAFIDEDCNDAEDNIHDDWSTSECVSTFGWHSLLQVD
jgi:hypothetical protein